MSAEILKIIILAKLVFYGLIIFWFFLIFKKAKPAWYVYSLSLGLVIFYIALSYPLKKMFWGNNGDEVFVSAFLNNILQGNFWSDFYYGWLPIFYSPLYFWVTGLLSRLFAHNGITAAKVGVLGTLVFWFVGFYYWLKVYWAKINKQIEADPIFSSSWWWFLMPLLYFLFLDFDTIITKPYEAITALFGTVLIGLIAYRLNTPWSAKEYLWFGISGGLLFLTFYFWWFIFIPVLFYLIFSGQNKLGNLKKILILGLIIFIFSLPYLIPLLSSFFKYGLENWQAIFFVPEYFYSFVPWSGLSLKSIIFLLGLCGLIFFRKNRIIQANLVILVICYLYQLFNLILALAGGRPIVANKPFLFLASASLIVGASYVLIFLYHKFLAQREDLIKKNVFLILVLIFFPLFPFGNFIESDVVHYNLREDLSSPAIKQLSDELVKVLPDYKDYVWLSSGTPDLNSYLSLSYYLAHNPHFSHQAANYSQRFKHITAMTKAKDAQSFYALSQSATPPITALLLYTKADSDLFNLYFWEDNYPNGGQEKILSFPKTLISEKYWRAIEVDGPWKIFIKK